MTSDCQRHDISEEVPEEVPEEVSSAFAVVYDHLALNHTPEPSDAIFCFGSRDPSVAFHAARLFAEGVAPLIMVSGGGRMPDGTTEAASIEAGLVAQGVPGDRIITEHRSSHTGENVRFGLADLEAALGTVGSVVSVAWPFAARRCYATLARFGPDLTVYSIPARVDPARAMPCTSQTMRWAVEQERRLVAYGQYGWIQPQPRPRRVASAVEVLLGSMEGDVDSPDDLVGSFRM